MRILHLALKPIGDDYAEFRYFWDNPNDYQSRQLALSEISGLMQRANERYYTTLSEDYAKTGQALYNWLDGTDRHLEAALNQYRRDGIVLAIAASQGLAYLPWEVLHDGKQFLVQRLPAIIPVRWVPDRPRLTVDNQPANRALNVVFMATAPRGIEPELDYEAEESRILAATQRRPLCLTVEESGCLEELGYLIEDLGREDFDVIHLTGHATIQDNTPCFITETPYGDAHYSTAEDIARELQFQTPKLIFLSGCRTGYSSQGTIPSMAEALLKSGATAVLGWGERVLDTDATAAAATLYQGLSAGKAVTEALAETYQELLRIKARDWHLLRLYVADTLPEALVKQGQRPVPRKSAASQFLDPAGNVRVATRETFVGRRRQLQNCLRVLKIEHDKVGVLIHGMGGLGKSAIAARLCDRLSTYEKIVWYRQIDEAKLVNQLADQIRNAQQRADLKQRDDELKYRLRTAFEQLNQPDQNPLLLILDDFEWNLEPRGGCYLLKSDVAKVLDALVWAIQESNSPHRILITCRYEFQSDLIDHFYIQGLDAFHKSALTKKLRQLKHFNSGKVNKYLIDRALRLADGNPRLLEDLNEKVLSQADVETKLHQLEANSDDWKGRIVWPDLYEQIDQPLAKVLSRCFVFELPVPMEALEALCESLSGHQEQLHRAIGLGLIEINAELEGSNRAYRVSRILPHIFPSIQLPEAHSTYALYQTAHDALYQLWGHKDNQSEEQWQELFRLKFANRDNPERFRQGFSQMLAVQYNYEADKAFEAKLRSVKAELSDQDLCGQLEEYLRQEDWQQADEETAWLFYLVMVMQEYRNWKELFNNFPNTILNNIDQLWVVYSNGHFGFSIQKRIWEAFGGASAAHNADTWEKFGEQVGWYAWNDWETYATLSFELESSPKGNLPALPYTGCERGCEGIGMWGAGWVIGYENSELSPLMSRLNL
ncbi:CHAT domain-containing protein (plasmid) [Leptolyngbya sp. NK1-12]|uniref:CHAT domain-containing protein n=1 Tax=Leptolyngbya sp. NK1-12 TaxID=2547451 RepID=A0AA96WM42_9CYAN|nr:CHAT domain-containing protein [Leptolyngbya sp. NK1-12]